MFEHVFCLKAAPYANLRRRQWRGTIGLVVCKFKPWDVKTIEARVCSHKSLVCLCTEA